MTRRSNRSVVYDHVIVGAGAAGCVLANRLSEDRGTHVLLLEAGPSDNRREIRIPVAFSKLFKSELDWDYTTEPQTRLGGRRLYWPRGKVLGGSSSLNAQMWVRGAAADYDAWEDAGNPGWSYRSTLPYFRKCEDASGGGDHTGVGGPISINELRDPNPATAVFVRACEQAGIPRPVRAGAGSHDGVDFTQVTQRRGARHSTASAYLRPAMPRPNLTVRTGAHVTRVVLDGRRAAGVAYLSDGEERIVSARGEVILAGGAVNSPQLLMLSGIGSRAQLETFAIDVKVDLPGVGRHLADHLAVPVVWATERRDTLLAAETPAQLLRYLTSRRGLLTSNVGEAHAFVRTRDGLAGPDLELIFAPVPYIDHGLTPPTGPGYTIGAVLLQPRSRGAVTLRSADPTEPPAIDPAYLTYEEDVATLVAGVRLAQRVFTREAFSGWVTGPMVPDRELEHDEHIVDYIRARAQTLYHPVGTCRMGNDPASVVDAELRVRGVDGLRVVDASVMPTITRGHTLAPTVMIAERSADLIEGRTPSDGAGSLPF